MNTSCPKCNSENTQSFEMAHRAGSTSGFAVGAGVTSEGDIGVIPAYSRQRTGVAKLTEPPQKDAGGAGESLALIFIALVIFNVVSIVTVGLLSLVLDLAFDSVSLWIVGLFIGLLASVAFGVFMWKRTEGQKGKVEAAYKAALMKWQHSWLCLKCGKTFYIR